MNVELIFGKGSGAAVRLFNHIGNLELSIFTDINDRPWSSEFVQDAIDLKLTRGPAIVVTGQKNKPFSVWSSDYLDQKNSQIILLMNPDIVRRSQYRSVTVDEKPGIDPLQIFGNMESILYRSETEKKGFLLFHDFKKNPQFMVLHRSKRPVGLIAGPVAYEKGRGFLQ